VCHVAATVASITWRWLCPALGPLGEQSFGARTLCALLFPLGVAGRSYLVAAGILGALFFLFALHDGDRNAALISEDVPFDAELSAIRRVSARVAPRTTTCRRRDHAASACILIAGSRPSRSRGRAA
jgi:hypothetical protein